MTHQPGKVEVIVTRPTSVQVDRGEPNLVLLSTSGPKETFATFAALQDLDVADKVDKSVVYYDESSGLYKADSLYTVITLTDGGNF